MNVNIWGKEIIIDDQLADEYKQLGNSLDEAECRYLAKTGGDITPDSLPVDIRTAIETSIIHTLTIEQEMPR